MSASSFSSFPLARKIIVAIDGPAGAGKSTIARHLARHFNLLNLETGAMYRAFALKALRADIPLQDSQRLEALAAETVIRLEPGEEDNRVLLDGEDVTGLIRNQMVPLQ
jgi:cytidylate kinase